jgi:hypothetical protein
MSKQYDRTSFSADEAVASIVAAPIVSQAGQPHGTRVFDLHPALHAIVFGGFAVWLTIMWLAFADAELAIPFVIFAIFLSASFAVPAMWARIAGTAGGKDGWQAFMRRGIDCATGHLTGPEAVAQVVIMPAMLVLWGVSVAIIHALV